MILAVAAAFLMQEESQSACVFEISVQVKAPQVVRKNLEHSTMVHLITYVVSPQ